MRHTLSYMILCLLPCCLLACDEQSTEPSELDMQVMDESTDLVASDVAADSAVQDQSSDLTDASEDTSGFPVVSNDPLAGDTTRPAPVILPPGFDNTAQVPLVISLHGYTGNGPQNGLYLKMTQNVSAKQFVLVTPNGTKDFRGQQFWNATDACCGFASDVDDEAYLRGLISEAKTRFNIDAGRVYLVGHSNGGFMSYRMACKAADVITGLFSFAGATYKTSSECDPAQPVHIIQMHGTADETISYAGGHAGGVTQLPVHPGAVETATLWAGYNGCDATLTTSPTGDVSGATSYPMSVQIATACAAGGSVELWTMDGGVHSPSLPAQLGPLVLDALFAHDRTPN